MTLLPPRSADGGARVDGPTGRRPAARFASHLNASDALLWTIERDPCLRSTIVAVSLLDRTPEWSRVRERIADSCEVIPLLRRKVVAAPWRVAPPRWERDRYFDLDYHLRRAQAPAPGDLRAVLDMAALIAMDAFDKDRPLWEFTLVEGLQHGRAAFIQKVHHSVTDGVGGMQMARLMLDGSRNPRQPRLAKSAQRADDEGELASLADWIAENVHTASSLSRRGAQVLPSLANRAVKNPLDPVASVARGVRSIGKLLAPVTEPLSPVMTGRGMSRWLDAFDVSLAEMRAAAHVVDGSVNDAFLAAVAGAMRRYHERHDVPVDALRVTMPINLRRADDPSASNRFTPARFAIPISTVDPEKRMRELGELARNWRHEPSLPLTEVIAGGLNMLPAPATAMVFGSMLKAIDFVATNVPGLQRPAYLAGAKLTHEYAFAPPSGSAFSVALMSHLNLCCIGLNADSAAVPDPHVLGACLRDGFDEVIAVGTRP
jgi:diacylglycerol O-acyltransferase / wax synthase